MKHANISIFIPHLGCPFNCIFCDQYKITGSDIAVTPENVSEILSKALSSSLISRKDTQIAFFGGSFTAIDRTLIIDYLKAANRFIGENGFESIRISTRPDCVDGEILEILRKYNVKTIELGIQSLDDDVLHASKRGYTAKEALDACKMIQDAGFELGMQIMCGLPKDSFEKDFETARKIIDIGCTQVRIYPVIVIKNTKLCDMYYQGAYTPLSVNDAVQICAKLYSLFKDNNVTVLKMGLHSSSDNVAGPFHPAFGELVRSQVFYNEIVSQISKNESVLILVSPSLLSVAIGNAKVNIIKFKENNYDVTIKPDSSLEKNQYKIKKQPLMK